MWSQNVESLATIMVIKVVFVREREMTEERNSEIRIPIVLPTLPFQASSGKQTTVGNINEYS